MRNKLLYIILFVVFIHYSCEKQEIIFPEGKVSATEIEVSSFDGISVSSGFVVEIEKGDEISVIIETQENVLPYIQVYVSGSTLFIEPKDFVMFAPGVSLKAKVVVPAIEYAEASGASIIYIGDLMECDKFDVELSGASQLTALLNANSINALTSGASVLDLAGNVHEITLESSGASQLLSYQLYSNFFHANISGAGQAKINVSQELNISASGASIIRYKGEGITKKAELSGGSKIIHD